jgi:hypothetical protein
VALANQTNRAVNGVLGNLLFTQDQMDGFPTTRPIASLFCGERRWLDEIRTHFFFRCRRICYRLQVLLYFRRDVPLEHPVDLGVGIHRPVCRSCGRCGRTAGNEGASTLEVCGSNGDTIPPKRLVRHRIAVWFWLSIGRWTKRSLPILLGHDDMTAHVNPGPRRCEQAKDKTAGDCRRTLQLRSTQFHA